MIELWRNKRTGVYHWVHNGLLVCKTSLHLNPAYWQMVENPPAALPAMMCEECINKLKAHRRQYG